MKLFDHIVKCICCIILSAYSKIAMKTLVLAWFTKVKQLLDGSLTCPHQVLKASFYNLKSVSALNNPENVFNPSKNRSINIILCIKKCICDSLQWGMVGKSYFLLSIFHTLSKEQEEGFNNLWRLEFKTVSSVWG